MDRIFDGCGTIRKRWPELWPRQAPPTGRRRGYNPEDPNIKPPSTPPPPPPSVGKLSKQISIVINMSEERLRALIQEEVQKVVGELMEAKLLEAYRIPLGEVDKDGDIIPVTLSNPSVASRIPAVPFPEIKAEDVKERIRECLQGEADKRGLQLSEKQLDHILEVGNEAAKASGGEVGPLALLDLLVRYSIPPSESEVRQLIREFGQEHHEGEGEGPAGVLGEPGAGGGPGG